MIFDAGFLQYMFSCHASIIISYTFTRHSRMSLINVPVYAADARRACPFPNNPGVQCTLCVLTGNVSLLTSGSLEKPTGRVMSHIHLPG